MTEGTPAMISGFSLRNFLGYPDGKEARRQSTIEFTNAFRPQAEYGQEPAHNQQQCRDYAPGYREEGVMMAPRPGGDPFISTGHLPTPETVTALVSEAHERFKSNREGQNSQVYPALARVPRDLFGICVVGTSGNVYAVGDADHEFTIMSVSKPFVFALVCQALGAEQAREKLGVNATGLPFNSLAAVEQSPDGRTNPMVNAGAIATTSLVPGATADAQVAVHPRRPVALRRPHASAQRRGLRVRVGNELPQPEHRPPAAESTTASTATRSRRPTSTPGSARST